MSQAKQAPRTVAKHIVKYTEHILDGGSNGKAPQIVCRLVVLEGPKSGSTLMWYGGLSDNSQQYTVKALRALGMTNDDIMNPVGLGTRRAVAVERENLWRDPKTGASPKNKTRIDFIDAIEPVKLKPSNPVTNPSNMSSKFKALFKSTPALELSAEVVAPTEIPVPAQNSSASEDVPESPF